MEEGATYMLPLSHGFVQCEAIRALALEACDHRGSVEVVGSLDDDMLAEIVANILVVLGVETI
ncbi:MAG: hypothetical protein RR619_06035 [Raoultibacter sp.]